MDEHELKQAKLITEIKDYLEFIVPFYPDLSLQEYSIDEIEKSLNEIFVKLIGKILNFSPENMRHFLRNYLLKYEIMNIKQLILGSIAGLSLEEKSKNINFLVEELLENKELIRHLLDISSLDEIQLYMRRTRYNKAIREGLLYYNNNREVFVLESFLDQLYYENLTRNTRKYNKKERAMIHLFAKYKTEIYNLNIMYRGKKNNIDQKLLTQFLVKKYLFLDEKKTQMLLNLNDIDDFISEFEKILKTSVKLKNYYKPFNLEKKHLISSIERFYIDYFFKKFEIKIDDIEYSTIFKLLEVIIKKDKEIKFEILPKLVKMKNERYKTLKSQVKKEIY